MSKNYLQLFFKLKIYYTNKVFKKFQNKKYVKIDFYKMRKHKSQFALYYIYNLIKNN